MKKLLFVMSCVMLCMLVGSASAGVTYVDAISSNGFSGEGSPGNTVATIGGDAFGWTLNSNGGGTDGDGLWDRRTSGPASGSMDGDAYQMKGTETKLGLTTTITGLTASSQYYVHLYYVSKEGTSTQWAIMGGLASDNLSMYDNLNGTLTGNGGGDKGFSALLGIATADTAGEIQVFVNGSVVGDRTIYDGVGYELVPEPATMALLGLGGLGLLRRRRKV